MCPAEHAGWLSTPLRRVLTDPKRLLRGLVGPGDTVVDLGCGPGFFTLPMAELVGDAGSVVAVDLQVEMLEKLRARAERRGLAARIRVHQCPADALGLDVIADFVLAFYVLHEVPDGGRFLAEARGLLKGGSRLLLVEPKGHVGKGAFEQTVELAVTAGLRPLAQPRVRLSRAVLLERS